MSIIGIVDTHVCNLMSVYYAISNLGVIVKVVEQPEDFKEVTHLIVPGVGCFAECLRHLHKQQLINPIINFVSEKKPLLGICLGMHLMAQYSDEFGEHQGLSLLDGYVKKLPLKKNMKLPHVGWNAVTHKENPLFEGIPQETSFYFAHSYTFVPKSQEHVMAMSHYHGVPIVAGLSHQNLFSVQFHPEKSHRAGKQLLKNFTELC